MRYSPPARTSSAWMIVVYSSVGARERRDERAARGIGEREERFVEPASLMVNHVVNNMGGPGRAQGKSSGGFGRCVRLRYAARPMTASSSASSSAASDVRTLRF